MIFGNYLLALLCQLLANKSGDIPFDLGNGFKAAGL